jgi:hypothetical protein
MVCVGLMAKSSTLSAPSSLWTGSAIGARPRNSFNAPDSSASK